MFLLHIPEVSKITESFSNSWYDVTDGLASAEQLKLMTSFWHAVWLAADVVNCLISGLTGRTIWQAHYITHEQIWFINLFPVDSNITKIIIHRLFEKICSKKDSTFNNLKSIIRMNSYKVKLFIYSYFYTTHSILWCGYFWCSSIIKLWVHVFQFQRLY